MLECCMDLAFECQGPQPVLRSLSVRSRENPQHLVPTGRSMGFLVPPQALEQTYGTLLLHDWCRASGWSLNTVLIIEEMLHVYDIDIAPV